MKYPSLIALVAALLASYSFGQGAINGTGAVSGMGGVGIGVAAPTVATPTLAPNGGTYTSSVTVTISDATSGSSIYYNVGSAPSPCATGTAYSVPLVISVTSVLYACATKAAFNDSAAANATYSITGCGPPTYPCSTSNVTSAVALPGSMPFSGLTGAGSCVTAPEPGNTGGIDNSPQCRLTDSTQIGSVHHSAQPSNSGSGFGLSVNTDDSRLLWFDDGGNQHFSNCTVNAVGSATPISCTHSSSNGFTRGIYQEASFSTSNRLRMFYMSNSAGNGTGSQLRYQSVDDATFAPTTVVDFATANGWVSGSPVDPVMPNNGDTLFCEGFTAAGGQDTGRLMAAYVAAGGFTTSGLYTVNLSTGVMQGPSGVIGSYNVSHGTLKTHQVATWRGNACLMQRGGSLDQFSFSALSYNAGTHVATGTYSALADGTQMINGMSYTVAGTTNYNGTVTLTSANATTVTWTVTCGGCGNESSGTATVITDEGGDPLFWVPGASDLYTPCGGGIGHCSGHFAAGITTFVNNYNGGLQTAHKTLANPPTYDYTFPTGNPCPNVNDMHPTIPPSFSDTGMLYGTLATTINYTQPCVQEIMFTQITNGENIHRFGHTYEPYDWNFTCDNNIARFSQTGNFAVFCSNMEGGLGQVNNTSSCTVGTVHGGGGGSPGGSGGNCRDDLFAIDLRGQ